jgi:ABC-type nitrate/sulfonate/bicarbonate transport system ATPase subunit
MAATVSGQGVSHSFGDLEVIAEIDLTVGPGEVLAVAGPSGCGKSTLLEIVAGLLQPGTGSVEVDGREAPADRLDRCAYMPQVDCLLPWYSALDNAALSLLNRGVPRAAARDRARGMFGDLGLAGFEAARPAELSGGMRQRVAFLRTFLSDKPVLLLDEPFAALDAITRSELQEWLRPILEARQRTAIIVTHDLEEALYLGDRVVLLSPRPSKVIEEVDTSRPDGSSRTAILTDPEFIRTRERLLSSLQTSPERETVR